MTIGYAVNAELCVCCGLPFEGHDLATCSSCGHNFHLALRADVPARDCGAVWINEDLDGIEFGCNQCLDTKSEDHDDC
jgi:hypothetical protein